MGMVLLRGWRGAGAGAGWHGAGSRMRGPPLHQAAVGLARAWVFGAKTLLLTEHSNISRGQTSGHMKLLLSIGQAWHGCDTDGFSAAPGQFRRKAKGTEHHGGQLWNMEPKGSLRVKTAYSSCQGQSVFWRTSFFLPFFQFPGGICFTLYT